MFEPMKLRATRLLRLRQMLLALCLVVSLLPVHATAQQQATTKRPLNHNDYDSWRTIQGQQLSRDGKFLAYLLVPQDADGEVVVKNLATGAEWRAPRGRRPDPPPQGEGTAPLQQPGAASTLAFTSDGRFLVFQIFPTKAETDKAKRQKKKPEEMPKNGLGIMDLS